MDKNNNYSDEVSLAYDLRQRYAKITGDHLEIVAYHRQRSDYPAYFSALQDLFTIVKHKFRESRGGVDKNKEEKDKLTQYNDLVKDAINIFNDHKQTYLGKLDDGKGSAEIEKMLRKIEQFLYNEMDEANMFGNRWDDDGL